VGLSINPAIDVMGQRRTITASVALPGLAADAGRVPLTQLI
jgi:hypothetical protein